MAEYIQREAILRLIGTPPSSPTTEREDRLISAFVSTVENFPAADVRPVVKGKWEKVERAQIGELVIGSMRCDQCHLWSHAIWQFGEFAKRNDYCPNCGADMKPPEEGN